MLSERCFLKNPASRYTISIEEGERGEDVDFVGEQKIERMLGPWEYGSLANHSCCSKETNCEPLLWGGSFNSQIVFRATCRIRKGEEILWNYGPKYVRKFLRPCICTKCKRKKKKSLQIKRGFGKRGHST
eukprot:3932901-Rhodomonas_salina.1